MLKKYRKEQRMIVLGLLSFHNNLTEYRASLKDLSNYEAGKPYQLFVFYPGDSQNIQGVIGVEQVSAQQLMVHDISLNPSYRGERLGFQMLAELQALYPSCDIEGSSATKWFILKWKTR
jgi:riboflavin biosynthesis RibT protein